MSFSRSEKKGRLQNKALDTQQRSKVRLALWFLTRNCQDIGRNSPKCLLPWWFFIPRSISCVAELPPKGFASLLLFCGMNGRMPFGGKCQGVSIILQMPRAPHSKERWQFPHWIQTEWRKLYWVKHIYGD